MSTILITGATDGIGREAAKLFAAQGHTLLLHGRSLKKLKESAEEVSAIDGAGPVSTYRADLSVLFEVEGLASQIKEEHPSLDVVINNAGVLKATQEQTDDGFDVRFIVNAVAPFLLTKELLPALSRKGRIVNLSSAAQAPVSLHALHGEAQLEAMPAYSQSKLAITMWSRHLAKELSKDQVIVAVNPGSLLGTKMVREGFGMAGNDVSIGSEILVAAALSDEFADASGKYYDNDNQRFADPHEDALDDKKVAAVVQAIEAILSEV